MKKSNEESTNKLDITPGQAESPMDTVSEEGRKVLIDVLNKKMGEKTESKETKEKSLEFEKDTFKIDSTGWKEPQEGKFAGKGVKVNPTGDVVEYITGPAKGEQIFISYDTFIREVCKAKNCSQQEVEKKYLMTVDEYKQKMMTVGKVGTYNDFSNKEVEVGPAGCWNPDINNFNDVGAHSYVWLVGGNGADFIKYVWDRYHYSKDFGFSGRLLKN